MDTSGFDREAYIAAMKAQEEECGRRNAWLIKALAGKGGGFAEAMRDKRCVHAREAAHAIVHRDPTRDLWPAVRPTGERIVRGRDHRL